MAPERKERIQESHSKDRAGGSPDGMTSPQPSQDRAGGSPDGVTSPQFSQAGLNETVVLLGNGPAIERNSTLSFDVT